MRYPDYRAHSHTHTIERVPGRPGKLQVVSYVAGSPLLVKAIQDGRVQIAVSTKMQAEIMRGRLQAVLNWGKVAVGV